MSSGKVVGVVVLTVCLTVAVMGAGWFAATRYLGFGQPTVTAAPEAVAPVVPAPRHKNPRTARSATSAPSPSSNAAADAPASEAATPPTRQPEVAPVADPIVAHATVPASGAATARPGDGSSAASAVSATPATVQTSGRATDARSIMEEAQRRSEARFYRYDGLLQSFDTKDHVAEKQWIFDREGSHGQSKTVLRFTAPAEVKGVALLIVNHPDRASDQWMWTPAIERDRRISLQDRSTRFFGTDFSFEDLEEQDVDQYDFALLGTEAIDGAECWKIQRTPKPTRASQYTKGTVWVRQDNYAYARLDNFVKDEVVRRLAFNDIKDIQGIWTARQLDMQDLRRHTRTRLTLQDVQYNVAKKDEDFSLQALRR